MSKMKVKDIQFYLDNVYYADGIKEDIIQTYIDKEQYENTLLNMIKNLLLCSCESGTAEDAAIWFLSGLYQENKEVFKNILQLFYDTKDVRLLKELLKGLIFVNDHNFSGVDFHEEIIISIMKFCINSSDNDVIMRVLTNLEILNDPTLNVKFKEVQLKSLSLMKRLQRLLEKENVQSTI